MALTVQKRHNSRLSGSRTQPLLKGKLRSIRFDAQTEYHTSVDHLWCIMRSLYYHNARRYVRMNLHSPSLVWLVNINTQFEESGRIVHPVLSISLRQGLSKWNGVNRPICHQNDPFEYRWSNRLKLHEKLANRYKKV